MTDRDEIDMLAAEYVLGTLDGAERATVAARRLREPELDRAIDQWDRRLFPLTDQVEERTPSPDLFARIEAQIDGQTKRAGESAAPVADLISIRRQLARWKAAAIGAMAVAASLAGFIMLGPPIGQLSDQRFVTVFQEGDQLPEFLLTIDLETRELTIRPVDAPSLSGKTYQLWIVADALGPTPKSLGLLEPVSAPTQKQLSDFDPTVLRGATFGISLEPEGGSPTGQPTGPALHGKLYPTAL